MRALERDPARRYQSARELRTDLMAWLAETGLSHDKRRIAEYLRSIFGAEKQRDADEFAGDGSDDDELILEKVLPKPEKQLQVDPEGTPTRSTWWHRRPPARCAPSTTPDLAADRSAAARVRSSRSRRYRRSHRCSSHSRRATRSRRGWPSHRRCGCTPRTPTSDSSCRTAAKITGDRCGSVSSACSAAARVCYHPGPDASSHHGR